MERLVWLFADSIALLKLPAWWAPAPQHRPIVYVGAFNGDVPEFFELFASQALERPPEHFVAERSTRAAASAVFEDPTALVFLSGGECEAGMDALEHCGVDEVRGRCAGLSAGAMVLAPQWEDESGELRRGLGGFGCRVLVAVHDEAAGWAAARGQAHRHGLPVLCIPTGGAVAVRGDCAEARLQDALLIEAGGAGERVLRCGEQSRIDS